MQASSTWIAKDVTEDHFVGCAAGGYAIVVEYID